MDTHTTEDTMDMADTMDTPTNMDTTDTIWERDPLKPNPPLSLDLKLRPKPNLGITDMATPVIMATMDILTITDITVLLERGPLKPNLKLLLPPRLRLNPGTDTMVDTTVIPTTGAMDGDADTMVVTG